VFIASLVVAGYVLSIFLAESGISTLFAFLIAVALTIVFVQLIRIFTRKPIDSKSKN
jgi:ABC-type antimicrobial peptide transport system permease subunit